MDDIDKKSRKLVCVTGGTGFVASCLIMRLLQCGYSVNATVRTTIPGSEKRDVSYLTNLPGASENLRIFDADLNDPNSFTTAIQGCIGVFHVAHPMEWDEKETRTNRVVDALSGILQISLDSKTVKRFIYTSSASAVVFNNRDSSDVKNENTWTDVEYMRSLGLYGSSYVVSKTLAERMVLEFGEKNGLDVVTVVPTWINGPFSGPRCPNSVRTSLALIFGDQESYKYLVSAGFVHVDDVARAHIFLFEHPNARGRYFCSAVDVSIDKIHVYISAKYPEYQLPTPESLKDITAVKISGLSTEKLSEAGFKYQYGFDEMFDGAIQSCKEKGFLN